MDRAGDTTSRSVEPEPIALSTYYTALRGQLQHEDDLISQRLNWLLTSQSFLFTAYAILVNGITPGTTEAVRDARHALLLLIPIVATVACLLIFLTVIAGVTAMTTLRRLYGQHTQHHPQAKALPPVQGYRSTRWLGLAAPVLLPLLFMSVWSYLFVRRLI